MRFIYEGLYQNEPVRGDEMSCLAEQRDEDPVEKPEILSGLLNKVNEIRCKGCGSVLSDQERLTVDA